MALAPEWAALKEATASGAWKAALEIALRLWRSRRAAKLAEVVDALAARVVPAPLRAAGDFHEQWLARANGAGAHDIGALLPSLVRSLPVRAGEYYQPGGIVARHGAWLERIAALERLEDDPRVAHAIFDVIEKAPWGSFYPEDTAALYDGALALAGRIGDERLRSRARVLLERPKSSRQSTREYLAAALPELIAAVERVVEAHSALDEEEAAICTSVLDACGAPVRRRDGDGAEHEAALLELVAARPDDDDAREVLADHWLEHDEPRGELVTLQLRIGRAGSAERRSADQKTVSALLRRHEKRWLGDLALVTKSRIWRRGFLEEAELLQSSAADARVWEVAALDPRLGTVRRLLKGKANEALYRRFVLSPAMRSLREIVIVSKAMLAEVCAHGEPLPLERLSLELVPDKKMLTEIERSAALHALSKLTFGVTEGNVERLVGVAAAFAERRPIETLAVTPLRTFGRHGSLAAWLSASTGPLARVPVVEVDFRGYRENRLLARRSDSGRIRLELVCDNLFAASAILPHLADVEHVLLRAPEHAEVFDAHASEVRLVFAHLPETAVELDDVWKRAVLATEGKPASPRHRDA